MNELNGNVVTLNGEQYAVQDLTAAEAIFPMSRSDFESGAGLTVALLASSKAKDAFDSGADKGMFEAVLDSDALAQIGLEKGTVLPIELRAGKQPSVPWGFAKRYR